MEPSADPRTDRIAETLVEGLCLDAGCTVNRAHDDQNGWDQIVEFPVPAHTGPADTRPPALTCFVQVKSTQTGKPSVRIKLSNALKLAKNPLPCFTALILFAEDGKTPTDFYLQHFDKVQIAQALKAARQAHADGETALNQKTVTLAFAPEELIAKDELVGAMGRAVPSPATYAAAKHAYASEIGYETGYAKGKLSFAREHVDAFMEAMLGRDVEVPVESMSVRQERFGIADSEALFDGPGKIRITPQPIKDCRVVVRHPASNEQIVLPGNIFVPGIPALPEEYRKIRIRTDILEFTCGAREGRNVAFGDFTASFGTEERTSIDRLDQLAALWSWFESGPLELELWVDDKRFLHGQIEAKTDGGGYWRALRRVTKTFAGFVDKDMRPSAMAFSLSDFADLSGALEFTGLMEGAGITMRMGTESGTFPTEARSYVTPIFLEFGSVTFFAVGRYKIKETTVSEGAVTVVLAEPSIQRKAVLAGSLADHAEFAREETAAIEKRCAQDGEDMVIVFLPETLAQDGTGTA